jgi:hypothetical protein
MEHYDPRRRQQGDDELRYPHNEERGRDRESWRRDDDRSRRASSERGWLDYDRNYGRSEDRGERYERPRYGDRANREGREEQRYGERGGSERSSFSPDWSREGEQARYSDEPYYARNRDYAGQLGRDDRSEWEQRARASVPREQRELSERSRSGSYYSPDWPYERGSQGRDMQRSRDEDRDSHYRGYYRQSATPFSYAGGSGLLYSESLTLTGPYAGRGPKGYKRSDQQVIEEASQRLERDGDIDASEIEVTAEGGILTLRGSVPDRRTKRRAEECVESVYGVRDVMNELRVASQGEESGSQGSQASQGSQRSQAARGSQSTGSQATGAASRAGSSASEKAGEERSPKH